VEREEIDVRSNRPRPGEPFSITGWTGYHHRWAGPSVSSAVMTGDDVGISVEMSDNARELSPANPRDVAWSSTWPGLAGARLTPRKIVFVDEHGQPRWFRALRRAHMERLRDGLDMRGVPHVFGRQRRWS
jgi:hypothetical protein